MKIAVFTLLICSTLAHPTTSSSPNPSAPQKSESSSEQLLAEAAEQLQRLSQFRRREEPPQDPFEYHELSQEKVARSDQYPATLESLYDLEANLMMQERIKRSGGLLTGIGNTILGKIASASSSASSASSIAKDVHSEPVEYGPPIHDYDAKSFDVWSFKRAIFNTLFQSLKAIGGGVIALKGQLLKGGGYLVQSKGKIISAKGEALTTLGRHIAKSAVTGPPKISVPEHTGFSFDAPHHVESTGHGSSYEGPPPNIHTNYGASGPADNYHGHSAYGAPSDDDVHAGVLILNQVKTEDDHQDNSQHNHETHVYHDYETYQGDKNPSISALEESFGGQKPGSNFGSLINGLAGASGSPEQNTDNHGPQTDIDYAKPSPIYGPPSHENHGPPNNQDYLKPDLAYGPPSHENHGLENNQDFNKPSPTYGTPNNGNHGEIIPSYVTSYKKEVHSLPLASFQTHLNNFDQNLGTLQHLQGPLDHLGKFALIQEPPKLQPHINFNSIPHLGAKQLQPFLLAQPSFYGGGYEFAHNLAHFKRRSASVGVRKLKNDRVYRI